MSVQLSKQIKPHMSVRKTIGILVFLSYKIKDMKPGQYSFLNFVFRVEEIRHTVEVDDLQPATSYTARVAGGNQADLSHFSTPVRFTTAEEGKFIPNTI